MARRQKKREDPISYPDEKISRGFTPLEIKQVMAEKRFLTGFTFVELLLSTTIVALVGAVVYSALANGIAVWRRANRDRTYTQNVRLTIEKMARELSNTFEFTGLTFEGTADSLRFAGLILSNSEEGEEQDKGFYQVGEIRYFHDPEEGILYKQQLGFPLAQQQEEAEPAQALVEHLEQLKFSYCYLDRASGEYKWQDHWLKEQQDSIARAVKIQMLFMQEEQEKTVERTVFIPVGVGEQTIEQGKF